MGRAVFNRKVRQGPDSVELGFDILQIGAPGPAVPVDFLRFLTGSQADDLAQMQLNARAIGGKERSCRVQHGLVHDQVPAGR